ncbi:MAG: low-complexity tail membrane protein [Cyanobacteria bacterium]|nr:low-complexity tail membrane protein [Cyanobacteriota bacterium]
MTRRQDPYLWWHVAGIATMPLCLDGCFAGLAVGDPAISMGVELGLLILVGTLPVLGLQWFRPFYLFRVGPLALNPDALTASQSRLLTLQRSWLHKGMAVLTGLGLAIVLVTLYNVAPIAASTTPFASSGRTTGWLLCAICFCLANWFGQTSISALGLLLARNRTLERTHAYEMAAIAQDFSGLAIGVGQIFPRPWFETGESTPIPAPEPIPTPEPIPAPEPVAPLSSDPILPNPVNAEPGKTDLPTEIEALKGIETGDNEQNLSTLSDPASARLNDQDEAVLASQSETADIDRDDHSTAPSADPPSHG